MREEGVSDMRQAHFNEFVKDVQSGRVVLVKVEGKVVGALVPPHLEHVAKRLYGLTDVADFLRERVDSGP